MYKRYIDPTIDFGFKHLFGDKRVLIAFLNALLPADVWITDLRYLSSEMLGDEVEGKVVVFDLHCETADGRVIIVEMQRLPQPYFKRRILYYGMRGFEGHVRRGDKFYDFAPVYVVCVVDFDLPGKFEGWHHRFTLQSDRGELFSDVLQLYFVELTKFPSMDTMVKPELTALEQWTAALKEMPALEGIPEWVTEEDVRRAFELSEVAMLDDAQRSAFEKALKEDKDLRGQVLQQYIYGQTIGREEGRGERDLTFVLRLYKLGHSPTEIAKMLGLDEAYVREIIAAHVR